jgi:hypothetical protein
VGGLILAWLIGEGIIVYRNVAVKHQPPPPGQMLSATLLFALLAAVAEYPPARPAATAFAFGVDLAVAMKPGILPGTAPPAKAGPAPKKPGSGPSPA